MSNVRDLGRKIGSLQNMQKVTKAMNMISSIKLRKLYGLQTALNTFHKKAGEFSNELMASLKDLIHPVVSGYPEVKRVHLVMFTADKGLCGTHNSSVTKAVEHFINEQKEKNIDVDVTSIGNKGTAFCRRKEFEVYRKSEIAEKTFTKERLNELASDIFERFMKGDVQKIYIIGNIFYSALQQETELKQILPVAAGNSNAAEVIAPDEPGAETAGKVTLSGPVQIEPSGDELAVSAGFLMFKYRLNSYLLHSLLSEHSSRMTAMENATNNSEDLINKYVTMQNHARQATITNELIEIVSGKEALKG